MTLVALTFILIVPNGSVAELVMGPNGHIYEVVIAPDIFVADAETAASGSELCGMPGHLATITSEQEDLFLESIRAAAVAAVWDQTNEGAKQEFWVGGYQDPGSSDVDENWHWVNDEGDIIIGATYTNWIDWPESQTDEPSDGWDGDVPGTTPGVEDDTENHLAIGIQGNFGWNDENDGAAFSNILGYIVEYVPSIPASAIPVNGKACVYFAGQSSPVPDFGYNETDVSIPPFIEVCGGGTLSISAMGLWNHWPDIYAGTGPEGYGGNYTANVQYVEFGGISSAIAPSNALVGVFLTDDPPDPGAQPASNSDPTTPELQQAFVIGSGLSGIQVPPGATRLFFGLHNAFEWSNNVGEVMVKVTALADIDIKPASCPNPLNVNSKGVLPVAILGSEYYNVFCIDIASICLAGVHPIRSSYEDVSTPAPGECECTTEGPDGYLDLTLKFKTQEIAALLGGFQDGDVLPLTLTGLNIFGTPIAGTDCVVIISKDKE
jgi:hypothetical protein